jgi:hypothetical protein
MLVLAFLMMHNIYGRTCIVLLIVLKYYYFIFKIKNNTVRSIGSKENHLPFEVKKDVLPTGIFVASKPYNVLLSSNHKINAAINNGYITLVWLIIPVLKGISGIPKEKQYAKWEITAKIPNLIMYFFLSFV